MFGAIGRWFKAVWYKITGQIDQARRGLDTDPHVMRAKFDDIIKGKVNQIHTYKQAVATLIAQQEKKMAKVKSLTEEVQKLENLKAGALAMAKQTVAKLQGEGQAKEEIHANEDYKRCLTAYNDFAATLIEKQDHIKDIEGDIREYDGSIANHKINLQQLQRDIEKLKSEAADAVADVITSKEETELADMITVFPRMVWPRNYRICVTCDMRCGPRRGFRGRWLGRTARRRRRSSSITPGAIQPPMSSTHCWA